MLPKPDRRLPTFASYGPFSAFSGGVEHRDSGAVEHRGADTGGRDRTLFG
jgi:hypothetical protein